MDLVVEHHQAAEPHRGRGRRRLHGGEQVGRTVGPGHGRIAHGARDHDRPRRAHEQVERVGHLVDRVRALRDHDAGTGLQRALDLACQIDRVVEVEVRARHLPEGRGVDAGHVGEAGHGGHEVVRGQLRNHPAATARRHRDRPAERDHRDVGEILHTSYVLPSIDALGVAAGGTAVLARARRRTGGAQPHRARRHVGDHGRRPGRGDRPVRRPLRGAGPQRRRPDLHRPPLRRHPRALRPPPDRHLRRRPRPRPAPRRRRRPPPRRQDLRPGRPRRQPVARRGRRPAAGAVRGAQRADRPRRPRRRRGRDRRGHPGLRRRCPPCRRGRLRRRPHPRRQRLPDQRVLLPHRQPPRRRVGRHARPSATASSSRSPAPCAPPFRPTSR